MIQLVERNSAKLDDGTGQFDKSAQLAMVANLYNAAYSLGCAAGPAMAGVLAGAVGFDWFCSAVGVVSLLFGFVFLWATRPEGRGGGSADELKQGLLSEDVLTVEE